MTPPTTTAARTSFSTEHVPERERFALWREACCEPLGLATERQDPTEPFIARVSRMSQPDFTHVRYHHVTRCHVARDRQGIARRVWDGYVIYREAGAGAWFRRGNRELLTGPGDVAIADLDVPFQTRSLGEAFSHEAWLLPRHILSPYLPASALPALPALPAARPTTRLLTAYLDSLALEAPHLASATLAPAIDTLCRLVGLACGAIGDDPAAPVQAARVAQANRYIDGHAADPALSPARVAAALGVSLRSLHMAFEPTGMTVARTIARRRLEGCRAALLADPSRPVTDIVFAWGFNGLSGFYRAFHVAFGASPGELRAAAMRGSGTLHGDGNAAARDGKRRIGRVDDTGVPGTGCRRGARRAVD